MVIFALNVKSPVIFGETRVLFVNVSSFSKVAIVPVGAVGKFNRMSFVAFIVTILPPVIDKIVLSDKARLAVVAGRVIITPLNLFALASSIVGFVILQLFNIPDSIVLFESDSIPDSVTNVPLVGKFTLVSPEKLK